jgi:hypothetical protein
LSTAEAIKAQNQSYSRSSSGRKSDLSDLTVDQSINTYEESTKTESSFNSSPSQSTIHTDKAVANTQRSSVSSISGSSLNSSYSQSTIHTDKAVTNTQRSSVSSISGSSVHAEDVATSHHSMSSKAMMNVLRARSPTPVQNLPGQIAPSVTPNLTTNDKGHHK